MKLSGLNIEMVRGESTSVAFTFVDETGAPPRLLLEDMFGHLYVHFRVKSNQYAKDLPTYVIDKRLDINNIKRFSDVEVLNLKEYSLANYIAHRWNEDFAPLTADLNRLFYHQDLKEYRYYDASGTPSKWLAYDFIVTVPFIPEETKALDYRQYAYDLILEAGTNENEVEYEQVLVEQKNFTIAYRV